MPDVPGIGRRPIYGSRPEHQNHHKDVQKLRVAVNRSNFSGLYNVANSIITDRKWYRCIFKVSFRFRGSLYEINVSLTLFYKNGVVSDKSNDW